MTEELEMIYEKLSFCFETRKFADLRILLLDMEPFDIAGCVENNLDEKERLMFFRLLPKELASDVFVEIDSDTQETLIKSFTDKELKAVIDDICGKLHVLGSDGTRCRVNVVLNERYRLSVVCKIPDGIVPLLYLVVLVIVPIGAAVFKRGLFFRIEIGVGKLVYPEIVELYVYRVVLLLGSVIECGRQILTLLERTRSERHYFIRQEHGFKPHALIKRAVAYILKSLVKLKRDYVAALIERIRAD